MKKYLPFCVALLFIFVSNCFAHQNPDSECDVKLKSAVGEAWVQAFQPFTVVATMLWLSPGNPFDPNKTKQLNARCWAYSVGPNGAKNGLAGLDIVLNSFQLNSYQDDFNCKTKGSAGNPIRLSDGVKYEVATDVSDFFTDFDVSRRYVSATGKWEFNLPAYAVHPNSVHYKSSDIKMPFPAAWEVWVLTLLDGNQVLVKQNMTSNSIYSLDSTSSQTKFWFSFMLGGTIFVNERGGNQYLFDSETASLYAIITPGLNKYYFNFDPIQSRLNSISDERGKKIYLYYKGDKVEYLRASDGRAVHYIYDEQNRLSEVGIGTNNNGTPENFIYKKYLYEDVRFPNALTGVIDENNIRFATWSYNAQGQAIESYHGDRKDYVSIEYSGNARTVANAMGKKTRYDFFDLDKVGKLIKSVQGQATENCLADVHYLTYFQDGSVQSETNNDGIVKLYERDIQGRVIKETGGLRWATAITPGSWVSPNSFVSPSDPSEVQALQTCWHPTLNQPSRIIEPTKITLFDYTATGQLKSQTVKPRPVGAVDCSTAL
ncbi:MAG TPA: hypothetical protein PK129_08130 [Cellvibrionaceae bacterium]|nr:hypothetical protein [Cellvibrionaceae bacterium]